MRRSPPVADRVEAFGGSKIREMFELAEQHDGSDLVRLEVGEPDFETPEHVVEAALNAARAGETHYTSTRGTAELRAAIADKLARENGVSVDPAEEVLVTTGGTEGLFGALLATVQPGAEVIIPTPSWPNYELQTRLIGGQPVAPTLPAERGFALDPEAVIDAIGPSTGAVVLTTPCNPTGRVYDPDAVRAVGAAAAEHGAYLIGDMVYERLDFDDTGRTIAAAVDDSSNVIEVHSFSKAYAMTGWRIGWINGPPAVIDAAQKFRQCTSLCPNAVSQHAAVAALEGPPEPFDEMKRAYRERRDVVVERVRRIPPLSCASPEGTFYVMVDVSGLGEPSMDIAKRLLREYDTVTTPGIAFGEAGEGHLRLSFANSLERIGVGLDRIEAFVDDEVGA